LQLVEVAKNRIILKTERKNKVGIQDIADLLNISASTVSRALNDHPRISKETKEKVVQAATKLGYYPELPELMIPEKAEAVAVLLPSLDSNLLHEITAGINNFLNWNNYFTFIINTDGNERKKELFFSTYRKYGISGVIDIVSNKKTSSDFYQKLIKDKLPVVTICEPDNDVNVSSVLIDTFPGFSKIIGYLQSLNINSVALLLEDKNNPLDSQLESSFSSLVDMFESEVSNWKVLYFEKDNPTFTKKVNSLLKKENRPEAIIIKNTVSAIGVMSIVERKGLKVPDDIILIAVGTDYEVETTISNLSLLKLPGFAIGQKAAEIIFEQITKQHLEKKREVLTVNFILKSSAVRLKS
jgi:LacI family transcriptional regulator